MNIEDERPTDRLRKNEKAVSQVFTAVLLLAVAVSSSVLTYFYIMDYLSIATARSGQAMMIQSVDFRPNGAAVYSEVVVYVQNVGKRLVRIVGVYVDRILITREDVTFSDDGMINEGETCTIKITKPFQRDAEIKIKVVNDEGLSAEGSYGGEE